MRSWTRYRYGGPEVLNLEELPMPEPAPDSMVIEVHRASLNAMDWHLMRASPFFVRFDTGLLKPKDRRIGGDAAGVVTAVGAEVQGYAVGDRVFGESGLGAFAQYVRVKPQYMAKLPDGVSMDDASALPVAGLTAIQAVRRSGRVATGEAVLVNGASGGVGSYALQIAVADGAEVTGVCSSRNVELVRSLGATDVIDYTQTDFRKADAQYDVIIDAVGNVDLKDLVRCLKPGGRAVVVGFTTMGRMMAIQIFGKGAGKKHGVEVGSMLAKASTTDLESLADLVASGKMKPVIDRHYPLDQVTDAIAYLETMRARGKVIIDILTPA